jgi:hypothetical protein
LSPAGAHARKRKIHRTGRHAAPTFLARAAKRAGRIGPAIALAGALATVPQLYHLATASNAPSASMAGDLASAGRAYLNRNSPEPTRRDIPHARGGKQLTPRSATITCSATGGMLPLNVQSIVTFFVAHGYSRLAAAGIAGNMYQESKGDPESIGSGGGGLIGFTPLPPGYVTGNPAADLRTQLNAVLTYNQQWAQYIPELNTATSATQAADIYMNYFERPGIPAAYNREGAAVAVAQACHL